MAKTLRIPRMKRNWTDAELRQWAAEHPPGTRVRYWPARNGAEFKDDVIDSEPWRLSHGEPIVGIANRSGGVALDHIVKLPAAIPNLPVTCEHGTIVSRCTERHPWLDGDETGDP
jgi:hypothetical protein